jgi:hypothetical protein
MGEENVIPTWQFKDGHYMWVAKYNIDIMTLNPHYLWEAKMLNQYIKHGTFLVKFDDHIKTIQRNWFKKIRNKTISFKND